MKPDTLHESPPTSYSISKEEFSVRPTELKPYKPGDRVNRENFVNFIIYSFAISRGEPTVQVLFLEWLKNKENLDFRGLIENFLEAGGWNGGLSEIEQDEFIKSLRRVSRHPGTIEDNLHFRFDKELKGVLSLFLDELSKRHPELLDSGKINNAVKAKNLEEFLVIANEIRNSIRAGRPG